MSKTQTLSKILKLKEERKKELVLEVKKMNLMVDAEHAKLHAFEKEYSDTLDLFDKKNSETYINAHVISSLYNYLSYINNLVKEQKKICLQKSDELEDLNNVLIAAHNDQKLYEKLIDRADKKELKEKTDAERKETDFLSITRYSTRQDAG